MSIVQSVDNSSGALDKDWDRKCNVQWLKILKSSGVVLQRFINCVLVVMTSMSKITKIENKKQQE